MTILAKGTAVGLALALSFGAASVAADARTVGDHHKQPANNGAAVSAVARSSSTSGEEHGDAVSAAARSNDEANGSAISAIASGFGATISALAKATTGANKGDTISDAAQMHGATVRAAARGH